MRREPEQVLKDRLDYIDGMRGIASILVIFCHLACVFAPSLYYIDQAQTSDALFWHCSPLNILTNGNFSVQFFFVISGFLITRRIYTKGKEGMTSFCHSYAKLLRVVLPAVLFSAFLMKAGWMKHLKAAEVEPLLKFVNNYNDFEPDIVNAICDAFLLTFIKGSSFVGPFWTIRVEFWGGLLIAAIAWYAVVDPKSSKMILLFFSGFSVIFFRDFIGFIFGALAYDCVFFREKDSSIFGKLSEILIATRGGGILAMYCACVNSSLTGLWVPISYLPHALNLVRPIRAFGIALCLCHIVGSPKAQKFFSGKCFTWLGKISAYIYAFHWPIILSLGCGIFLSLREKMDYMVIVYLILFATLIASIGVAWVYAVLSLHIKCFFDTLKKRLLYDEI